MTKKINSKSKSKAARSIIKKEVLWPFEKRMLVLPGWETGEKKVIKDMYDIILIHVTNKICVIYLKDNVHTLSPCISLKLLEDMLDPEVLFHAGRAYNVNMLWVVSYKRVGRCGLATLINGEEVPVSYRQRNEFEALALEFGIIIPAE